MYEKEKSELEAHLSSIEGDQRRQAMGNGLSDILATRTEADLNRVISQTDMSKLRSVANQIREHRFALWSKNGRP